MSLTAVLTKRRPGRPRKNPEATQTSHEEVTPQQETAPVADTSTETATPETTAEAAPAKRRPGRPKGSKNKPKDTTATAPAVKRGPGRPRKNPEAEAAPAKRRPGRPKGSKNKPKDTTATAPVVKRGPGRPRKNPEAEAVTPTPVKRGPGRPRKNPEATETPAKASTPQASGSATRKALQNPFKVGESIQIPSGSIFTSSAPTAKGRQVVRRGHNVTVHDIIPARVQPRKSEKGSNVLVRPARIRAKGSGGYWKDITLTEKIVRLNGKTPNYEEISYNPQEAMAS